VLEVVLSVVFELTPGVHLRSIKVHDLLTHLQSTHRNWAKDRLAMNLARAEFLTGMTLRTELRRTDANVTDLLKVRIYLLL